MNINKMAYPDTFLISGLEYKGKRNQVNKTVKIPFTEEPNVNIGDNITQKIGASEITLKVIDISILPDGTRKIGTNHPNMLTLHIENLTSNQHSPKASQNTFNIASVSGAQVQIGENNHLSINISIPELVEKIAASGDAEAKTTLRKLLENNTVAGIIGAGATALFGLL